MVASTARPDQRFRSSRTRMAKRFEHYLDANRIIGDANAAKRRSVFLSVIGPTSYQLLRSLLTPVKLTDKTFNELAAVLKKPYNPRPSEVMQNFPHLLCLSKFLSLRTLWRSNQVCDRLVHGINDSVTQQKLLAETDLTYQKALAIALGCETAKQKLKELRGLPSSSVKKESVNQVARGDLEDKGVTCHHCGTTGHLATQCKFKDWICHQCGKKGHLARVCHSKLRKPSSTTSRFPTSVISYQPKENSLHNSYIRLKKSLHPKMNFVCQVSDVGIRVHVPFHLHMLELVQMTALFQ